MSYDPLAIRIYPPRGREGLWRLLLDIDRRGPWSTGDFGRETNVNRGTLCEWLGRLRKGGYVEQVAERPHHRGGPAIPLYRLTRRPVDAPRLARDGSALPELGIETLWRTIKMLKAFSLDELVAHASRDGRPIRRSTASSYLNQLSRVGILQRTGTLHHPAYRLLRNLGARAPKLLSTRVVYDPNAGVVIGEPETVEAAP